MYGPGQEAGQVLTGLPEEREARLIAGSNGHIVKYELEPESVMDEPIQEKPQPANMDSVPGESRPAQDGDAGQEEEPEPCDTEPATEETLVPGQEQEPEPETTAGDIINTNLDDLIKPASPAEPQKPSPKSHKCGGK